MSKPNEDWRVELEGRHDALTAYLHAKVREADWHGVCDAANDLRCLETEMRVRDVPVPE